MKVNDTLNFRQQNDKIVKLTEEVGIQKNQISAKVRELNKIRTDISTLQTKGKIYD